MQNTVPTQVKPSGGIVAQRVAEQQPPAAAWKSMTLGAIATAPVNELLQTLGVRIIEVPQGELAAEGLVGWFVGRVGSAEIQIERTLPQADREPVVRDLLARITPSQQSYGKRAPSAPRLRPATVGGNPIHIECPAWCTSDHVEGFLVDVFHTGEPVDLVAPTLDGPPQPLLHARLHADTFGTDVPRQAPHIVVDDESQLFAMTPAQALEFADDLVAFAAQVRALAEQAGR
ncbi:DUF6907 domain-containing protein [Streptomyces sp. NRRL S-4]|uniref:DUF6907 domain-containing protein n=1 Tax=Streptomyces sp. NRRL S-4 TaxID=1519471 RepID=UPI0006B52C29|nr:hypothetical protein [Streptomyces sp. NRRL S-4]KPC79524.1 hypothetical protein ADK82_25680 [Streptomyces sp. NRRL S-4]